MPAHPRSRGENTTSTLKHAQTAGSSPLTRGKRRQHEGRQRPDRLIPAHAGKTRSSHPASRRSPAHPRSRGENPSASARTSPTFGSSPLTRGKPGLGGAAGLARRLIPAHAGKTSGSDQTATGITAHPRSRGENGFVYRSEETASGSSPLTRGKHRDTPARHRRPRLIPAHAGKTVIVSVLANTSKAHPRSRGENDEKPTLPAPPTGSSPLTRGKHRRSGRRGRRWRLIPAHAGKTAARS